MTLSGFCGFYLKTIFVRAEARPSTTGVLRSLLTSLAGSLGSSWPVTRERRKVSRSERFASQNSQGNEHWLEFSRQRIGA